MDLVRRAINDIRTNWGQYPQFMRELREFMGDSGLDLGGQDNQTRRLEALFSSTKEWLDPTLGSGDGDYSAIQLYTSEYGYRKMFGTINTAFRSDGLSGDSSALRCATFLVELLTIDLFNYRARNTQADNFEGHVYRGMCVSAEDLSMFAHIAEIPIEDRYLAIPLAMASASTDRATALAFALEESSRIPERFPLLWDIKVSGMDPGLLAIYQDSFPASIVTSLCAVPIDQISDYRHEKEVVLRGPHFQILRLTQEDTGATPKPLHVIEAVMLNGNRDHISAIASNIGEDRRARDLFRAIVIIQRSMICAERAEICGLAADAKSYHAVASRTRAALDALTGEVERIPRPVP